MAASCLNAAVAKSSGQPQYGLKPNQQVGWLAAWQEISKAKSARARWQQCQGHQYLARVQTSVTSNLSNLGISSKSVQRDAVSNEAGQRQSPQNLHINGSTSLAWACRQTAKSLPTAGHATGPLVQRQITNRL